MRAVRAALLFVALGVLVVGIVGVAVHAPRARSGTAQQIVDAAVTAMVRSGTYAVRSATADIVVGPGAGGGTLHAGNSTEMVVAREGSLFVDTDAAGWTTLLDRAGLPPALDKVPLVAMLAGRWVHVGGSEAGFTSFDSSTNSSAYLRALVGTGPLRRERPTRWHGTDVVPVADTANGGEVLYLTARGAPAIVGASGGHAGATTITPVAPTSLPATPEHPAELALVEDGYTEQRIVDALHRSGRLACTGALDVAFQGASPVEGDTAQTVVHLHGTVTNHTAVSVELSAIVVDVAFPPDAGFPVERYQVAPVPGADAVLAPGASTTWSYDAGTLDGGRFATPTVEPLGFVPSTGPDPTGAPPRSDDLVPLATACAIGG